MEKLNNKELSDVSGGILKSVSVGVWAIIGGAISFGIGLLSGWVRPYPCSSTR